MKFLFIFLILLGFTPITEAEPTSEPQPNPGPAWRLVYSDEFSNGLPNEKIVDRQTGSADGITVVDNPLKDGRNKSGKVLRFFVHKDHERAANKHRSELIPRIDAKDGLAYRLEFKMLAPENHGGGAVIAQWHGKPDKDEAGRLIEIYRNPPVEMRITRGRRIGATATFDSETDNITEKSDVVNKGLSSVPLLSGWNNYAIEVKFAHNGSGEKGFLKIWHNGELKQTYTGPLGFNDARPNYLKFGIYKHDTLIRIEKTWVSTTLFFDDIRIYEKGDAKSVAIPKNESPRLKAPVEFFPKIVKEKGVKGGELFTKRNAKGALEIGLDEAAVIMIDTWNGPGGIDELTPLRKRQKAFLEFCRREGITVIFAPNMPAVGNYPQYHTLKKEVEEAMVGFEVRPKNPPPFMSWPPASNDSYQQGRDLRKRARDEGEGMPRINMDISRHLQPLSSEYVLKTYEELRYVLWKEKATCLFYAGEYLNECIQQRETGINRLAGTDQWRTPITIVVLQDLVAFDETEDIDEILGSKVMLDYFKRKIAFVSRANDLVVLE